MEDSILNSIKQLIGIESDDEAFDIDLIIHINTFLGVLNQLGIGEEGFCIYDDSATWDQFLTNSGITANEAKTYVYLRVQAIFDSQTGSVVANARSQAADELGWRLMVKAEVSEAEA